MQKGLRKIRRIQADNGNTVCEQNDCVKYAQFGPAAFNMTRCRIAGIDETTQHSELSIVLLLNLQNKNVLQQICHGKIKTV